MSHSKSIGLMAVVGVFLVTMVAGIMIHWRFAHYGVWLSTTSTNNKYTVELTGDKGRGGFLVYAVVKYNLLKNGQLLIKDQVAHSGDSMDISFELAYPEHAWINENTLRFWRNPDRPADSRLDTLLISNNTDKVIKFLRIRARDMSFVFDIQPHSQARLPFSQQSEGNDIWTEGEFEDGSRIEHGMGLPDNSSGGSLGYCMAIDNDRVIINSLPETGYDHGGSWSNLSTVAAPGCKQ